MKYNQYNEFLGVTFEKNGIFKNNKSDIVYNCLIRNGITDLQKLFYYDDYSMIDYGSDEKNIIEIKGVIRLLRYKYLKESLDMEFIFNKRLNSVISELDMILRSLGFNKSEVRLLINNKYIVLKKIDISNTIFDLLKENYDYLINNSNTKVPNLLEKLEIILDYAMKTELENTDNKIIDFEVDNGLDNHINESGGRRSDR